MNPITRRRSQHPSFDPRMLGSALKVWLDVSGQTDGGTLSIPDRMGGSPATQPTAGNKPAVGTTSNGITKLTNAADDWLQLPLSAGINDADYFGMAMWLRPSSVASSSPDLFNVVSSAGAAAANRISVRVPLDDLSVFTWIPPAPSSNVRSSQTAASNALLQSGAWKFVAVEYVGSKPTEAERVVYKDAGTIVSQRHLPAFSQAQGTALDTPSTLVTTTGNAILFNRQAIASPTNGFLGDVTDVFFYDPRLMSADALVQLAQYEVPVG